jgi:hydroxymethylpyrimidine/phosphomethylpyrimidine kinase
MQKLRPYVLCIGGFDPSGGAGVLADIKTLEQIKVVGLAVLSCNTLQTENEFVTLDWFETEEILRSIRKLTRAYSIKFVKIGVVRNYLMFHQIVDELLSINPNCKIIWDTVLGSSSGFDLFELMCMEELKNIMPKLFLLTPNALEFELLNRSGVLENIDFSKVSVLKKGGHNQKQLGVDVLMTAAGIIEIINSHKKLPQKHGSGCVLASAITGYLSLGNDLETSCRLAKKYINKFLNSNLTLLGYHYE